MSGQAVIDSLEFARSGQQRRGSLAISGLSRLRDALFDDRGEVEYLMRGSHDTRGRPALLLEINGALQLRCQRCLEKLDYPLSVSNTVLLVGAGEVAAGNWDEEDVEWIEASAALDVACLIEDEILLSLPYAPRHDAGRCQDRGGLAVDGSGVSAFARLGALKRKSN